jgi:transcriptional regulator with XRE-family HTH domain
VHPFGELSARRQELGAALRRLRKNAGLSGEQMAAALEVSQSRVSRMELGQQLASPAVVIDWARVADAPQDEQDRFVGLAEEAAVETISWRKAMSRGLAKLQEDTADLEATARLHMNFQTMRVPGLLQVPEYARRVFAYGWPPPSQADIAAAVTARMNRQAILFDESKRFEFIMTEAAVRWRLGPLSLMRAQVDRIITVSALENVSVGIIPQTAEANVWHDHDFNIADERGDNGDPVVHFETLTRSQNITEPDEVAAYKDAFTRLRQLAVTGDDARRLITLVAEELRGS